MHRHSLRGALAVPLLLLASPAYALELVWEGHYRAEGHLYDSLSLSRDNTNAEGLSSWLDHKARLRPGFLLSERVGMFTQLDLLPSVMWGQSPGGGTDLTTGSSLPLVYDQSVNPPTTTEGGATLQNLRVSRVWGEVWFPKVGTLRFGRMPVQWGSGLVFNAGNDPGDDYGDTEDRVSFTGLAGPVHIMGAVGLPYEGYVNENDGLRAVSGSVAHLAEQAAVGFYSTYRWQSQEDQKVGLWIGDLWGKAELGPVEVETELASVFGRGDLDTGANDVSIMAFGGQLTGGLELDKLHLGLNLGFATGDGDTEDKKLRAFAFDPDYDVGLMMFEQPMPVLAASVATDSNEGRNLSALRTHNGLSNALYLRPSVGYSLRPDLAVHLSFLAAQTAKLPEDQAAEKGYGSELDLNVDYRPFDHFRVDWTGGLFFPGSYYSNYEHPTLGGDFGRMAVGSRVQAVVEF